VDVLIFAAASHDVTEPATANIVQAKLGASRACVFDLKNACNSVMSALDVATAYIDSGRAQIVLVTTGEVPSLVVDRTPSSRRALEERFAHLTIGDAGGAL
jgi:3-oxoacyl-[acyl-carrier-protein] synthase-3